MKSSPNINLYGPFAILVEFEQKISKEVNAQVINLYKGLLHSNFSHVKALIPAYNSLVVQYHYPVKMNKEKAVLLRLHQQLYTSEQSSKTIKIPVCYDLEMGLDLAALAKVKQMTIPEVISMHTAEKYHVYMLGFTPGFPYLGGLNEKLAMPRKASPRISIPKGSVAIANEQTGIYPTSSPGGWQVIGRTPVELFTPKEKPKIEIGDTVTFYAISLKEFNQLSC